MPLIKSFYAFQFPGQPEVLLRGGQAKAMNWGDMLECSQVLFASEFGASVLQATEGLEPCTWSDLQASLAMQPHGPLNPIDSFQWAQGIEQVQNSIQSGRIEKLVLARHRACLSDSEPDLLQWWKGLRSRHAPAFCYAYSDPVLGMWMGASPEHLLQWKDGLGTILSLAGTLREGQSWTEKEQLEQSVTSRFIEEVLQVEGLPFEVDSRREIAYGEIRHLRNEYRFDLPKEKLADLLLALNPTPAVAGYPQHESLRMLKQEFDFERGAYSGVLGYWNGSELQAWVQLRCARLFRNGHWLFAGAGINAGSVADMEWAETQAKMDSLGL
ncbi:MAG: chorismate-binding protein [Bacteroidia bacterium]